MTLLIADSFEWATVTADLTDRGYTNADATKITLDTTGGPDGDKALKFDNCGATDFFTMPLWAFLPTNGDPRIFCWIKTTVGYSSTDAADDTGPFLIQLHHSGSADNLTFGLSSEGGLTVYRMEGGGVIERKYADNNFTLNDGNWHRLEIYVISANTGHVEIYIDGEKILTGLRVDMINATVTLNELRLGAAKTTAPGIGNGVWFKNVVVWDDVGTDFTGVFGSKFMKMGLKQGQTAGTSAAFTPSAGLNHENVDELPQDGDTTYNESSTSTNRDLFNYADASENIDGIDAVLVSTYVRNTDVGSISWRAVAEDNTSVAVGGSVAANSTTFSYDTQAFYINPDTLSAYTKINFNSSEFGYEVV